MIAAGEDPRFIARRLIIAASEDVGNADPRALQVAVAAAQALDHVGLPEAQYALAQATVLLPCRRSRTRSAARTRPRWRTCSATAHSPVPGHLRNAADRRMKQHGIGVGLQDPHDYEGDDVEQQYLPDALAGRHFYVPTDQGQDANIAARMADRAQARSERPRRKQRTEPPMASMSDAMRPRETNRKKLADTQKGDAS